MSAHLQRCFESGDSDEQYRRMMALRLEADDDIVVHASRFAASHLQACGEVVSSCSPSAQSSGSSSGSAGGPLESQVCAQPEVGGEVKPWYTKLSPWSLLTVSISFSSRRCKF